jgi:hypothetical protein
LLATVHPDRDEGDAELFVFLQALREHVEGCLDGGSQRRVFDSDVPPGRESGSDPRDRVPFGLALDFVLLSERARILSTDVDEPYASLLREAADCPPSYHGRGEIQQRRGATYRTLAAIAHAAGFTKAERVSWYRIAESVPLAQAHASHLLSKLRRAA